MLLLFILFIVLINQINSFVLNKSIHSSLNTKRINNYSNIKRSDSSTPVQLNEELEGFFEKAALTGSERIKQLTIEERAEYAQKGAFLEDEIYLLRDQLADIETKMLNGDIDIDRRVIQDLRDELNALKDDYINLVGAHDLPLYFGKAGSPDSYQ